VEDVAPPPLLLGPADREGPALLARRKRALTTVARARVSNAWPRLGACATAGLVTAIVFNAPIALFWLAGFAAVVAIDREIYSRLLKRCAVGDPPARLPWLIAWTVAQSAYGNLLAVVLWFAPYASGQTLAAIYLCGGFANAAATLRQHEPLSLAGMIPTTSFLLGLPLAEFIIGGARNSAHLVPLIGAVLLLAWGAKLWRSLQESDAAMAQAEASAVRERQAAASAAAAKTDMITRMNDELRTPMLALIGAAEHLRRAATTPDARAHIATLAQAGEVLKLVLSDLSDLDRLENDDVCIDPKPTDARALLRGVAAAFAPAAHDKHLEMFADIAPDAPALVEIDAHRVRQILFNLFANAVRYTTHGGVRARLSVKAARGEGRVELAFSVADTGGGMSRARIASVLGRTRISADGDGPGLGLAISSRLARLMGGRLQAKSELGQGSVFCLVIEAPISSAQAPEAQTDAA
jgi:signal transduction histidine kinase